MHGFERGRLDDPPFSFMGKKQTPNQPEPVIPDSALDDALESTRSVHRLLIAASLATLVFSLSIRLPEDARKQLAELDAFLETDFKAYNGWVQTKASLLAQMQTGAGYAGWISQAPDDANRSRLADSLSKPVALVPFKVGDALLADPGKMTLKALEALEASFNLKRDSRVALLPTNDVLPKVAEFLEREMQMPNQRLGASVQTIRLVPVEDLFEDDIPGLGSHTRVTLSFELSPNSGPPMPVFQEIFDAQVHLLPGTGFLTWLEAQESSKRFFQPDKAAKERWLPRLVGLRRDLREKTLGDIHAELSRDLVEGSPEKRSVSLLGTEVPGVLFVIAAPVTLLALLSYLHLHVLHLLKLRGALGARLSGFAWFPLQQPAEGLLSLGILPVAALATLGLRLWSVGYLGIAAGIGLVGGMVAVAGVAQKALRNIEVLRSREGAATKPLKSNKQKEP